jgi:tetratricopeptide (TPR) repeat protein
MPIITEKNFINMDRLARRKKIKEKKLLDFYTSFTGNRVPEIPFEELSDEEKAEDLAYEVLGKIETNDFEYDDLPLMFDKARQALALCSTCIAAHEAAYTAALFPAARDRYMLKGVDEGEKKFGGGYEKENAGHFWEITETRPFMRLLAAKADWLREQNKKPEAAQLYERMLRLHPDDACGIRYPLHGLYLEFHDYDKFIDLTDQFEDDYSPHWLYNYALYLYMVEGETTDADEALKEAIEFNPHVLPYLQGKKKMKKEYIPYYNAAEETGAVIYCRDALYLWRQQMGIQRWLRRF